MTPSAKREAIGLLTTEHGLSVTRACRAVRLSRAAYYRPVVSQALTTDAPVIDALQGVVAARPRWGFWKCFDRLRLLGCQGSPIPAHSAITQFYAPVLRG